MSRDFKIPGEAMVYVRGRAGTGIANMQELGLCQQEINVQLEFHNEPINLDAWGKAPADVQTMLAGASISMDLIHYDRDILDICLAEGMGGASAIGKLVRAGTRLGGGNALYAAGNKYISLGIASPIEGKPWRFFTCYMDRNPARFPMGTKKSVVRCNWTVIPYTVDPWGSGAGATDALLWDHVALS